MKFGFVILHYKTAIDTINCIESINQINKDDEDVLEIVVVDNASNNGSIEEVKARFEGEKNIFFILNKENLGFARGNNCGYSYAKDVLKSDFIFVLNNDIVIQSNDITNKVKELYRDTSFAVMGPDIISEKNGEHQNPPFPTSTNRFDIIKEIIKYSFFFLLSKIGLYNFFKKMFGRENNPILTDNNIHIERKYNCQLHGAFLVFSPNYLNKEKFAFYPKTFLYCEEAILYQHCMQKHYLMIFDPQIKVKHKEDSSTDYLCITNKRKREFVFYNLVKARIVYLQILSQKELWN